MAIEAPYSKYRKTNFKIYIVICAALGTWFCYDGYFNEKFKQKHVDSEGRPDSTLVFNQKSPPLFIAAALFLSARLFATARKKVIADENQLIINNKEKISYGSIQKIDKTYFDSKGHFIITYENKDGSKLNRKLSSRVYDNLEAVLNHLVAKIS